MLKSLSLKNFRNYQDLQLDFRLGKGLTYLIGDNAQGKTNLLEAIYSLIVTRSFLGVGNEFLIGWGGDFARVKGVFERSPQPNPLHGRERESEDFSLELFLGLPPNPRRVLKLNDVKTTLANYLGQARVVIFHPFDLNLLYLGPEKRRGFLDTINAQLVRGYLDNVRKYLKALRQRNALLKKINAREARREDLEIWTELLVETGVILTLERAKLVAKIEEKIGAAYEEVAEESAKITLEYHSNLGLKREEILSHADLRGFFLDRIAQRAENEIAAEHTLIGPHRDDFSIFMRGKEASTHASRGEIRTLMLALKFMEIGLQQENSEMKPLLLLDDVLSELDHQRQILLLEKVKNYQTIISTTKDSATINQEKLLPGDFMEVRQGEIFQVE